MANLQSSPEIWKGLSQCPNYEISSRARVRVASTGRTIRGTCGCIRLEQLEGRPSASIKNLFYDHFPELYWRPFGIIIGEIWADIPEFEGFYQASSEGRIRSILPSAIKVDGRLCNPPPMVLKKRVRGRKQKEYHCVALYKDSKRIYKSVHRLVAGTFHPNSDNKPLVHHIDNDPFNNAASNLKWATREENMTAMAEIGTGVFKRKKVVIMDMDCNELLIASGIRIAGKIVNPESKAAARRLISNCCVGRLESYLGYKFKFFNQT